MSLPKPKELSLLSEEKLDDVDQLDDEETWPSSANSNYILFYYF